MNSTPTQLGPQMTDGEFTLFQSYIERECAIVLGQDKKYLFECRLARLLPEHGCLTFLELYRVLQKALTTTVRDRIVDAITTHETLWFRDEASWLALQQHSIPELVRDARARGQTTIRVWSAACSTGQEPYSLAMLLDDYCAKNPGCSAEQFAIVASDISPSALFVAKAGRFDAISMNRGFGQHFAHFRPIYFKANRQREYDR